MQIHPDSIKGTAEAAAWHLHGASGGRRIVQNHQLDYNYSVMTSRGVQNARGGQGDDDHDNEDTFDENYGMNDGVCNNSSGIHMGMDVEEGGMTTLSAMKAISTSSSFAQQQHPHCDQWSTGVAAAIATSTATRYYKSFFLFPHGRRVLLPIFMGAMASALSLFVVFSCQFMTVVLVPSNNNNSSTNVMVNQGSFQLGPWRYLSINPTYSDGEVCLPYPSDMVMDTNFMIARSTSAIASCLGCALVLWTCTLLCVPATKGSMNCLGFAFVMNGVLQCMTAIFYQSENCKADDDNGGGYFGPGECRPNQDLVISVAAGILYLATGWIVCMSHNFAFSTNNKSVTSTTMADMEVYTWSSEAKSSNPKRGILRTVEKSWVKVPNGSTVMATVFVEQRKEADSSGSGGDGGRKMKTTYQIQTEILPA